MARIVIFGLVTRKLHVVYENVDGKQEWYEWAKQAVKSAYGYDWQGDNVLLAFFLHSKVKYLGLNLHVLPQNRPLYGL